MAGWRQRLTETARRNRAELVEAKLSRRDLFMMGLLTGSGYLVAKLGLSARAVGAESPASPPTTPWIEPLPVPVVAAPSMLEALNPVPQRGCNRVMGESGRAEGHQSWNHYEASNTDFHVLENRAAMHSWHRELPLDELWAFNGQFPGPRIHARYGRPVLVRFKNQLPSLADHRGYGRPTPSTHLHNAHTASESDGHPMDAIDPGAWKDHLYLNRRAGFTEAGLGPQGDVRESLGTLWYHDHCLGFSAQNVYRGNVGLYHLFDEFDSGDESDPSPTAWRLPSGEFDVPLVFHDRIFDSQGRGYFDLFDLDGILGDKVTVNGRIQPFLRVARRKYRFRAVNMGPGRWYALSLSNGHSVVQISHDGNMLPAPRPVQALRLAVGQRADFIVDFSQLANGTTLYLVNRQEQFDGRGPTGRLLPLARADRVLKFRVDGHLETNGDPSRVPERFHELPSADEREAVATRTFVFDRTNGGWTVNNKPFDPDVITATPRLGTAETWTIANNAAGWTLPVHIHLEEHQVLARNGQPVPTGDRAREDVLWLGHGESVKIFRRFRDFLGRYPTHCHNVLNGDHATTFMWKVVPS